MTPDSAVPPAPPARKPILSGSIWMIGARWAIRFIGLISTIILARLLAPEDFGLVALALLVTALNEVCAPQGQALALIRHPNPTREHWDSAWTLSVYIGGTMSLLMFLVAPYAADYLDEPKVLPLIQFLSLRGILGGLENIGVAAFRKDLRFDREFGFMVGQKVITFTVTVGLALILRDYWALAIGAVVGRLLGTVLSYMVHPYRPRLCHARMAEILPFSLWMQASFLSQFLSAKTDEIVVGGSSGITEMGFYNVGADVATAPTDELVKPLDRAMYPIYATQGGDLEGLRDTFLDVFSGVALICCATGVGVALVAQDMVLAVLGSQWGPAAPLMVWLALSGGLFGMLSGVQTVFGVTGHARLNAWLTWATVLVLGAFIFAGWQLAGTVEAIAIARAAAGLGVAPLYFYALTRVIPVTLGQILARLWRPVLAALAMTAMLDWAPEASDIAAARLAADILLGAVTYTAAVVALWLLAGRPAGFERAVLRLALSVPGRVRAGLSA